MKRLPTTALLLCCCTFAAARTAQPANDIPRPQTDTLQTVLSEPAPASDLVRLQPSGGELRLEIAGYGITLGNREDDARDEAQQRRQSPQHRPRKRVHLVYGAFGIAAIEFGVATLTGTRYGPHWVTDGDFLETRPEKSFSFGGELLKLRILLDNKEHWWITSGLRFTDYDLAFNGKHTLQTIDGLIRPEALDPSIKKSKLSVGYMGIPLGVTFSAQRFNLTLRATGEMLIASRLKYKKPKHKSDAQGLSPWRWTVGGMMTYRKVGLYANYSITPLFKKSAGPEAHILSMGLYLGF